MRLFGFHPVREALRSRPHEVERVLIARRRDDPRRRELQELCRRHHVELREVEPAELGGSVEVHNGVAADLAMKVAARQGGGDLELVVLLEDVQDPRNLGAILRVCEGAGVGRVLIRDRGAAPMSPLVEKASAGASSWLAVERVVNSGNTIQELKQDGYWVYGAAAEGVPPWQIDLKGKVVLCLGGEASGLRHRTRELCDGLVGLPMRGRVESLNVATAAAALLYDAVRQRTSGSGR
jgi:23S rRNA (guanosine2251-2'-O)-methyltransferase